MAPSDGHSFRVKTCGQAIIEIGAIHGVLDILLSRPRRRREEVDFKPPAEAAPKKVVVDNYFVLGKPRNFGRRRLRSGNYLDSDPHFAAVLRDVNRAVDRLHGCVCKKWDLVDRIELGLGTGYGLIYIAVIADDRAYLLRRLFHLGDNISGG